MLNKDKLRLRQKEVRFIRHLVTSESFKPDPEKVKAVEEMPNPEDVADVRRFLGFVNCLSKFIPSLNDLCESLGKLTLKDPVWSWQEVHYKAVAKIKQLLTSDPVLRYFDPNQSPILQCDGSETGLGAAILQEGRPIVFA